jgi:plastocyanin
MVKAMLGVLLLLPAAADESFTVSGTVKFDGPVPAVKVNKSLAGDPACCALHKVLPPRDELVVNDGGGVRWAFVYVTKGLEGRAFNPPAESVLIDQVGCLYTPHVAGAMVGQVVNFRNSDPMGHNVHGLPFVNKEFNFGQPPGSVSPVKFTSPEVMVKVVCNVHPWMATWIGVLDHPYFAVTDAAGKFEIKNLPPGTYKLGIWHEGLRTKDKKNEVEVVVKANHSVDFLMEKKGE